MKLIRYNTRNRCILDSQPESSKTFKLGEAMSPPAATFDSLLPVSKTLRIFQQFSEGMETLKRRLSFRKKKDPVPECSKPHQWQEDEKKVRDGTCSFQVRYLGCIEVFESRGMQVCEDAVKALKAQSKGKYQRAILYVSGSALRVVDEISKSMIVDQTIEKVSFCAPDRNHEKGFAYICRDGTTRRWMCHGFLAVKESGERLSHAVGCAFSICLERKQKRDKESGVTVTFSQDRTSFTRMGSFRQASLTERIADPQSAILAEPVPQKKMANPFALGRPKASTDMLQRQGSFRGFSKLQEAVSPFKRSVSLRLGDLPSTLQRQNAVADTSPTKSVSRANTVTGAPIEEMSPDKEDDSIAQMCQQLTQGLSAMTTDDPFAAAPHNMAQKMPTAKPATSSSFPVQFPKPVTGTNSSATFLPPEQQTQQTWSSQPPQVQPGASGEVAWPGAAANASSTNPFAASPLTNGVPIRTAHDPFSAVPDSRLHMQHARSHSIDTGDLSWQNQHSRKGTLELSHQQHSFQQNGSVNVSNSAWHATGNVSGTSGGVASVKSQGPTLDPFDVAWAAKSTSQQNTTNPFSNKTGTVKTFEVKL
ncbi:hypothetical protein ScPMuIL_014408 [Solemya velum]